jgi:ankyrin repeat protein
MILKELLNNPDELKTALKINPNLITEQDEDGMTLLHHAAQLGQILGRSNIIPILDTLFETPGIDFNIKDLRGNTPVHVAAICSKERVTCSYLLPTIVQEAVKKGFNFETQGEAGQTVLHIVARNFYTDPRGIFPPINSVEKILNLTNNAGLNTLSTSGSTALFYAINQCNFQGAFSLLNAGADPTVYGSEDRSPIAMLDEHLSTINNLLGDSLDNYLSTFYDNIDDENDLVDSILSYDSLRYKLTQLKYHITNNLASSLSSIAASSNAPGSGLTKAGFFSSDCSSKGTGYSVNGLILSK